jgi:UDP-glucose 4-epimerase
MIKVLITGGAGFIGYHLSRRLLTEPYQIDLLDNLCRGVMDRDLKGLVAEPGVKLLNIDLLQPGGLEELGTDYDYIYHLGAIIGVTRVLTFPLAVLRDNALMLLNVLSLAQRQKALQRLVFASTSEVYAGTLKYFDLPIPTPESTPLAVTDLSQARTSYMLSKIYGEALCHHSGYPFTIIRPHNVFGPRMGLAHVIPELLQRAYEAPKVSGSLEVFSVDHRRTFCYISDAVEMIKAAAEAPSGMGETLNIGNQAPEVTIEDLATIVLKTVGKKLKIIPKPSTPGSPRRRCPDMSKTQALTQYQARVGLEQGIKLTYEWYKEHIYSGTDLSAK